MQTLAHCTSNNTSAWKPLTAISNSQNNLNWRSSNVVIGESQCPLWWCWDKTEQEFLLLPNGVVVISYFFLPFPPPEMGFIPLLSGVMSICSTLWDGRTPRNSPHRGLRQRMARTAASWGRRPAPWPCSICIWSQGYVWQNRHLLAALKPLNGF